MFIYNGKKYQIIVEKKKIKNMYLRIRDDLTIYITTNLFTSKKQIQKFIDDNYNSICKMIDKKILINSKEKLFYYLGNRYDIIYGKYDKLLIDGYKIYAKDEKMLDKWFINNAREIFKYRLERAIYKTEEALPIDITLRVRKMKTRWGVCNRKNNTVTLNLDLIKYDEDAIDYVIFHELAHFTYPNHQKDFWNLVSKYVPDYKEQRKKLK